jgi:hypothetical protein
MRKQTSVFDNPISKKRFLQYLEEKERKDFEIFKRREGKKDTDNSSELIINALIRPL